jgi:very-short-patch-repair endonuclease
LKKTNKELLVALLPRKTALKRLKNEGWYHIPVDTAPKRWPPQAMAFFQGKVFGDEDAYKIRYYGDIERIDILPRKELFRTTKRNEFKAERLYYRVQLKELHMRYTPILSHRPRRLVFLPTTLEKFEQAEQINDLFDGSPLEDRLWRALKYISIPAERQWKIVVQDKDYFLDFAIFCKNGKLAVETDGYTYHYDDRNQIDYDTWRRNDIEIDGWRFLHYTTRQVKDNWTPYLVQIQKVIVQLGGVEEPENYERKVGEGRGKYIVDGEDPL